MYSGRSTPKGGFPHSDISGSKLRCQLPGAFRRLARPSSPVIAKASTTCTSSLDPITLDSGVRCQVTGFNKPHRSATTLPYAFPFSDPKPVTGVFASSCPTKNRTRRNQTQVRSVSHQHESNFFFHVVKELTASVQRTDVRTLFRHSPPSVSSHLISGMVEDDGFEPTTPCLQSRCSPS